jgi:hypothetical protein
VLSKFSPEILTRFSKATDEIEIESLLLDLCNNIDRKRLKFKALHNTLIGPTFTLALFAIFSQNPNFHPGQPGREI